MTVITLEKRILVGKANKKLRRVGIVPGGISHANGETSMVQASDLVLLPLRKLTSADIFEVEFDGKKISAVIAELIVNPLTNKIESFSFTELIKKSHVTVRVPVEIVGISPAVKNNLGTMVINLPELKLTVNKENIIAKITVDVSNLMETGSRILVSQIDGIEKLKLASEKDRSLTIVTIRPLRDIDAEKRRIEAEKTTTTPVEGEAAPAEGEAAIAPAAEEKK